MFQYLHIFKRQPIKNVKDRTLCYINYTTVGFVELALLRAASTRIADPIRIWYIIWYYLIQIHCVGNSQKGLFTHQSTTEARTHSTTRSLQAC
jgi:hypothetical protein